MSEHCYLNIYINYKVAGVKLCSHWNGIPQKHADKQHVLMNRYTVVGDESDYELNTKLL